MEKQKGNNRKKYIILGIILFILIISIISYYIGNYFINYALVPGSGGESREIEESEEYINNEEENKIKGIKDKERKETDKWKETYLKDFKENKVSIINKEGLKLIGHTYFQKENKNNIEEWVILAHGYQGTEKGMENIAKNIYNMGYNILTISHRAHEPSEGKFITMGEKEKDDLIEWTKFLEDEISKRKNTAHIYYHGVSMGGATVCLTSQKDILPKSVKGIISDCAYTSVWDIFTLELKKRFGLGDFPVLELARLVAIYKAKVDIKNIDVIKNVKDSTIPIIFIHTEKDDFVPSNMSKLLFDSKEEGYKELHIFPNGNHADAQYIHKNEYYQVIKDFLHKTKNK